MKPKVLKRAYIMKSSINIILKSHATNKLQISKQLMEMKLSFDQEVNEWPNIEKMNKQ